MPFKLFLVAREAGPGSCWPWFIVVQVLWQSSGNHLEAAMQRHVYIVNITSKRFQSNVRNRSMSGFRVTQPVRAARAESSGRQTPFVQHC